ncbi:MAG: hypothetical protein ABJC89_00680 [Acidobacteriota bacterium]
MHVRRVVRPFAMGVPLPGAAAFVTLGETQAPESPGVPLVAGFESTVIMKRRAHALAGLLSQSATVMVAGQGRGAAPQPAPAIPTRLPLAQRIVHEHASRHRPATGVHAGASRGRGR